MQFLRARRNELTKRFWSELMVDHADAPPALAELARGDKSVVCDEQEAEAAIAWARAHPAWLDDPEPVYVVQA